MTDFTNPYDAVIADLEAKRAEIDSAIQVMKRLRDTMGSAPRVEAQTIQVAYAGVSDIPRDAFFGMTIVDAALKFLRMVGRTPQPTKTIIEAFDQGGLKNKNYGTVYGVLNRRAREEGDIVNVHGDWGLAEWYNVTPKGKKTRPTVKKTEIEATSAPELSGMLEAAENYQKEHS